MGISNLFDKQWQLDAEIEQKHPVQSGEDRMPKKLLALQMELGELTIEFRSFKFWSNDQEPRIKGQSFIHKVERFTDEVSYRNPILEEFVDSLHFILSIGNDLNFKEFHLVGKYSGELHDTVNMFLFVNEQIALLSKTYRYGGASGPVALPVYYGLVLEAFLLLGEVLGFTEEQIVEEYEQKNQTNWERQAHGY